MSDNTSGKTFNNALRNFTFDMASRGAIRHLFDLGYSAEQIHNELTFPTPIESIRNELWNYLVESGVIILEKPTRGDSAIRYEFIRETNEYGRQSFRRVPAESDTTGVRTSLKINDTSATCDHLNSGGIISTGSSDTSYIPVFFGREKYKDPTAYKNKLSLLKAEDKAYLEDLPWPLQTVWHRKDERIMRILKVWDLNDQYS